MYRPKKGDLLELKKCILLSVAYSANLGGTGTIIGIYIFAPINKIIE